MTAQLMDWMTVAWGILQGNHRFMVWNTFLAVVPLALSFWLFHKPRSQWLRWGVFLILGATFLPTAHRVFRTGIFLLQRLSTNYLIWILILTLILMSSEIWHLRRTQNSPTVSRSLLWWLGFVAFIAFLPNAPYVLTDVIHLINDIRAGHSAWIITLALIPQYLIFMMVGFQSYVLSLIYLTWYMERCGLRRFTRVAELVIHGLTAVGIYLGRFQRFNSWDIVTDPDILVRSVMNDLIGRLPVLVMIVTFVVIMVLYWLFKQLTLALMHRNSTPKGVWSPVAPVESPARDSETQG
ncbi:DUF1361 domain-containing protein [Phormidium pseudopriestleyi FRX01]|uniref:DUF1361 domain-containing protein n=1 Tax=Phormidium pseudopriestleyi FRX01 TaxID=1759528 RepID=A0ABS3FSN1_9CYAN|nr:DUF1361 domain-containing protein [Phormidium pseudopriestleyi]MBO0350125.1 DUF1361 domain-containing protein [Phormidium pseudopriestleyi FRX01]